MIKACPLINKFEKKINFWSIYAPFESSAKCNHHRGLVIFPACQ